MLWPASRRRPITNIRRLILLFFAQANYSATATKILAEIAVFGRIPHTKKQQSAADELREAMLGIVANDLNVQPLGDLLILKRFSGQAVDEVDPLLTQVGKDSDDGSFI